MPSTKKIVSRKKHYEVDRILNGWFGEPPEWSDHEQQLIQHLYGPLRRLEDELIDLPSKLEVADVCLEIKRLPDVYPRIRRTLHRQQGSGKIV